MTTSHPVRATRTTGTSLLRPLAWLGALALVMGLIASCGTGSGSTPPGTPNTQTILILPNAPGGDGMDGDGTCSHRLMNQTDGYFLAGDGELDPGSPGDIVGNQPFYGFLYFPLSQIPTGATILSARVYLTAQDGFGSPFVELGRLKLVRIASTTAIDKDAIIAAPELTYDLTTDIREQAPTGTIVNTGQLAAVQAAHSAGEDLFIRLEFEFPTNNNKKFDTVHFASVRHLSAQGPRLEIVIEEQ